MKKIRLFRIGFSPFALILGIFLTLYAVSLIIPLLWGLMTSFKLQSDFRLNVLGLPDPLAWNYSFVLSQFKVPVTTETGVSEIGMGRMYVYTLAYSLGCAFFNTSVPCITAYCCARFRKKLSKILYTVNIVTMILPIVGSLPAELQMARTLGLYDQIWGLWIMKANFLGTYFLVFHAGFRSLSLTYTEAAEIDGAGSFHIFFRIILPLVKNIYFTVLLVNFIAFWNDYQVPLLYMPRYPTLANGVYMLATTTENNLATVPMRMTGAMLLFLPIFCLFIVFQKRLLGSLTMGGIKG